MSSKAIAVDLGAPSVISPGRVVRILVSIVNYEDAAERIRIRAVLPAGWKLVDTLPSTEVTLESGDEWTHFVEIAASSAARVGTTGTVRFRAHPAGDPGAVEGMAMLRIARGTGLPPGAQGIAGRVEMVVRGIDPGARRADPATGLLDLSGTVAPRTTLSLQARRGARVDQAPVLLAVGAEATDVRAELKRDGWTATAGNLLALPGNTLTGSYTRAAGGWLKLTGSRPAELMLGQPVSFSNARAGLIARGSWGVTGKQGGVRLAGGVLDRPGEQYTVGNTLRSAGLDADGRLGDARRLSLLGALRLGGLAVANDTGIASHGLVAEASLVLSNPATQVTLRGRRMPAAVPGTYLPGDEVSLDASRRIWSGLRANGRAYRGTSRTVGSTAWGGSGSSLGLSWAGKGPRVDLRGTARESFGYATTTQRTVSGLLSFPLGPVSIDFNGDLGRQTLLPLPTRATPTPAEKRTPVRMGRAAARWMHQGEWATVSALHSDYGTGQPLTRYDATVSLRRALLDLDGGAWVTKGPTYGGTPGVWATAAVPMPAAFDLVLGGEWIHGRVPYTRYVDPVTGEAIPLEGLTDPTRGPIVGVPVKVAAAPFRLTLGVRRRLTVALRGAPRVAPAPR